jgi:hypothetical protein
VTAVEYEKIVLYVLNRYVHFAGQLFENDKNEALNNMTPHEIDRVYACAHVSDRRNNNCQK